MTWWLLVMLLIVEPQAPSTVTVRFGPFESEAACHVASSYGAFRAMSQIYEQTGKRAVPTQFACATKKGVQT